MHLGLYPIGLLSTSSSWEGKRQMYSWSPKWDGTKDNNLSRDEKVLFKELCFDGVLFWSFRASCYPCMPSNPLLFFFYFFLPQGLLWLFFVTKFNCPPFLSAALHHKPHGTFLGLCNLQKPTAPLFLWSGRCKALEPRFFLLLLCWGKGLSVISICHIFCVYLIFGFFDCRCTTRDHIQEWKHSFPSLRCVLWVTNHPKSLTVSWRSHWDTKGDRFSWLWCPRDFSPSWSPTHQCVMLD